MPCSLMWGLMLMLLLLLNVDATIVEHDDGEIIILLE